MKFMLNGAITIGTMDGANVEMAEEVGEENMFIFGASSDEIISWENHGGYNPMEIFNSDQEIRRVLMQLINGSYSPQNPELFRDIYNSLLNTQSSDRADTYFKGFPFLCGGRGPDRQGLPGREMVGADGHLKHRLQRQVLFRPYHRGVRKRYLASGKGEGGSEIKGTA